MKYNLFVKGIVVVAVAIMLAFFRGCSDATRDDLPQLVNAFAAWLGDYAMESESGKLPADLDVVRAIPEKPRDVDLLLAAAEDGDIAIEFIGSTKQFVDLRDPEDEIARIIPLDGERGYFSIRGHGYVEWVPERR